jgi:D-alanyl-D-alanine carboxypeptidase/D-alanyl-D-alanine-endopeptidase (penicillin-binding protein 4)
MAVGLLGAMCVHPLPTNAQTTGSSPGDGGRLASELADVLHATPHQQTRVGAVVLDLATNEVVYAAAADRPLTPASSMKVFVIAAALDTLGGDFVFATRCAVGAEHLYLIGDGDPCLGDPRLAADSGRQPEDDFLPLVDALKELGVVQVPGDIVVDDSIFDDTRVHPTWESGDLGKWYAAPVGGLNYNDNCVDVTVYPGSAPGSPARIEVVPTSDILKVVNRCRTGGKGDPILHHPPGTWEYIISGRCQKEWRISPVAFHDPGLLVAAAARETLMSRANISHAGELRRKRVRGPDGSLPDELHVVATLEHPLGDALRRAGKNSQNLFAECLLKRTGYEWSRRSGAADPVGSWETGPAAVRAALSAAGVNLEGFAMQDGSGLSRDNRCTPRQLAATLAWMHRSPYGRVFHDSLSIAGVDGSLRRRLRDVPGRVVGKTGTMRSVRTLAGYVLGPDGPRYAFAIMFNGYPGSSAPYKELQDRFCRVLIRAASEE